jgi:phosphoglycerate dehydrogenase-like enzyme
MRLVISERDGHGRIGDMSHGKPVLVLAKGNDPQLASLQQIPHTTGSDVQCFKEAAGSARVILNWSGTRDLLRQVLGMCPNLQWIHSRWAGLDSLLFPELVESDVILTNGRGVFSPSLGEFALAAILYFAKDFRRMIRNQAAGVWRPFDVEEIAGKTVGIVGYGDIGRAVATRVRAMGMRVLAMKRHPPQVKDPLIERYYGSDGLHGLLAECDYVVATAPLTEETRHMIGEAAFAAMKPTAVVINVGRGPVIDEAAMVRALASGKIKGAGLDVFEEEPLPAGHPLYKLENVLLSPHCADNTPDWKDQAMAFFLEQYERFAKDEPLENVVNKRLGY